MFRHLFDKKATRPTRPQGHAVDHSDQPGLGPGPGNADPAWRWVSWRLSLGNDLSPNPPRHDSEQDGCKQQTGACPSVFLEPVSVLF